MNENNLMVHVSNKTRMRNHTDWSRYSELLNRQLYKETELQIDLIKEHVLKTQESLDFLRQQKENEKQIRVSNTYKKKVNYFDSCELIASDDEEDSEDSEEEDLTKPKRKPWTRISLIQLNLAMFVEAHRCLYHGQKKLDIKDMEKTFEDFPIEKVNWDNVSAGVVYRDRSPIECEIRWREVEARNLKRGPFEEEETKELFRLVEKYGERGYWDVITKELSSNRTMRQCFSHYTKIKYKSELSKGEWTSEEDKRMIESSKLLSTPDWTQIALKVGSRSHKQCAARWKKALEPSIKKGYWTTEEDEALKKAVDVCGVGYWSRVQKLVPGRTDRQCRDRFNYMKVQKKDGTKLTIEEGEYLKELVGKYGTKWDYLALFMPGRTARQLKTKYNYFKKNKKV